MKDGFGEKSNNSALASLQCKLSSQLGMCLMLIRILGQRWRTVNLRYMDMS